MRIETITYKRIKNLGNFNSEHLEATAIVSEDDNPDVAADILKEFVLKKTLSRTIRSKRRTR
ncbi:hypothetical protein [Halotia branconii]|uniref:Uncharacterized protein n=1 Tax=Halotia branconii CENA392 TaxID=1539056 RepID=A0AAJ6NSB2_9CYAN|nr:hypothetical protein [Halotia branconii]WGV25687.1 hypothetical protein QI031_28870 [Halotia branconii CENA392]